LYFYLSCYFRCSSEVFWDLPLHRVNCRHYSLLLANVLLCCPMSCPFPLPIAIAGEIDFGFRSRYYLPIYKSLSCGLAGCWLCPRIPSSLAVTLVLLVSNGFPPAPLSLLCL